MDTLTFYLQQHTPLIDFQHYQDGSTLRASAVKPQLDRFLINLMGGREIAERNNWLARSDAKDSTALNYRMNILPTGERDSDLLKKKLDSFPNFFGNMKIDSADDEKYKRFTFYPDPLEVTLTFPAIEGPSLAEFLRTEHRDALAQFFFRTNFGTRASKGFGSYYLCNDEEENPSFYISPHRLHTDGYAFRVDTENNQGIYKYKTLFRVIELFYKALRSGIVEYGKNGYKFDSLAHRYCNDVLKAVWDKQGIKKVVFESSNPNPKGYCDIKDTLGFSTNENWRQQQDSILKKIVGQGNNLPTRMQSPLLFKPIANDKVFTVYLIFKEEEVKLDEFLSYRTVRAQAKRNRKYVDLTLPHSFRLEDFFKYILSLPAYVEDEYTGHPYTDILNDIFNQLKQNPT